MIPTSVSQQIAGTLSSHAYLPTKLPTGFLYTDWESSPGSGSGSDVTIHFAGAGKRLTWQVATHDDSFDCSTSSLGATSARIGSLKVYGRLDAVNGKEAWTCIGAGKGRFEVSAASKSLSLAVVMNAVGSAKLAPQLPPARVAVARSGYQDESGLLTFEVELHNVSTVDAIGVTVNATFVDNLGRSLATASVNLTGVPAGGIVYAVGSTASNVTLNPASVQTAVSVERTQPKSLVLPPVGSVNVQAGSFAVTVTGSLTDPYAKALPTDASIYAVYLDGQGDIIGGDDEDAGAAVEPHANVGFSFDFAPSGTSSALVSVNPCDSYEVDYGGCPALTH